MGTYHKVEPEKERVCAGPQRGTRTTRSMWGSRVIALRILLWTSSKYNGGDISGKVHNTSVTNQQRPLPPAPSQLSSNHFPCYAPILNAIIHGRIMCFSAKCFYCKMQEVNNERTPLLWSLSTHCPLTFLMCMSLCLCLCVAFLFKASAFLGVGGNKEGRQQLFRKAASSVKFTKYHQHCWTNE